jgi:hypothetical protein
MLPARELDPPARDDEPEKGDGVGKVSAEAKETTVAAAATEPTRIVERIVQGPPTRGMGTLPLPEACRGIRPMQTDLAPNS